MLNISRGRDRRHHRRRQSTYYTRYTYEYEKAKKKTENKNSFSLRRFFLLAPFVRNIIYAGTFRLQFLRTTKNVICDVVNFVGILFSHALVARVITFGFHMNSFRLFRRRMESGGGDDGEKRSLYYGFGSNIRWIFLAVFFIYSACRQ